MASSDKDASCANDPDFAVICAFLEKFSEQLQVEYPDFKQLQDWLTNTDEVPNGLRDLHVKLMRKTRRTVHECAWETALSKFCFSYSSQDGWEIERFGYKKSSLKVKLRILRELLESQFDRNNKFRAKILTMSADSLRSQPIGRDRLGHSYWLTQDLDCNLRIYQEHLDEEIWQVVATNRDELVKLITRLKGNEVVLPSEIGVVDEDSSSNSCSAAVVKPPPPEEKDDSQESNQSTEGRIPNIKIKLGSKENGVVVNGDSVVNGAEERPHDSVVGTKDSEKKVKPLVISQSKITMERTKKRSLDEIEKLEPEEVKKQRPSLLDSKREKKLSKYEKAKQEDDEDEEQNDDEDDGEEEGEEEEEDESAEDGEEEEEDDADEEIEGEEDVDENVEREDGIEEDDGEDIEDLEDVDDIDDAADIEDGEDFEDDEGLHLSEEIEDPPLIVSEEGSGKECENGNIHFLAFAGLSDEPEFSETIEEATLHVFGEGTGSECLVGNAKTSEPEPKATFFFGQPGCLKLSPVKTQTKVEDSDNHNDKKPEDTKHVSEPANGENHKVEDVEKKCEAAEEGGTPSVEKADQNDERRSQKQPPRPLIINRKRRLSDDKPEKQRHSSESETDLNSEVLEEPAPEVEETDDIGGKRIKMRSKLMNTEIRKKVEAQRQVAAVEETTSSSEEERPRKKIFPKKIEKDPEPILPLKAKLKQAAVAARALEQKEEEEKRSVGVEIPDDVKPPEVEAALKEEPEVKEKLEVNKDTEVKQEAEVKKEEEVKKEAEPEKEAQVKSEAKENNPELEVVEEKFLGELPTPSSPTEFSEVKENKKETINESHISPKPSPKQTKKPHPDELSEDADGEVPKKKQSPEQTPRQSPLKSDANEKERTPEKSDKKSPEPVVDDHSIVENQRKRRSSEDDPVAKQPTPPKSTAPPPVLVKTRTGRRGGPPEPVAELPQPKRTRVKASTTSAERTAKLEVKKETPTKAEGAVKGKAPGRGAQNKAAIKQEVAKEEPVAAKEEQVVQEQKEVKSEEVNEETKVEDEVKPIKTPPKTIVTPRPRQQAAQKQPASGHRRKTHDAVDAKNIIDVDSEATPVRQSRRIAQLKIREEAERRKMEEIALRNMKAELKKKKKAEKAEDPTVSEPSEHSSDHVESEVEVKKKAEKKKKCPGKGGWSSGSEEPEEEEEEQYETDPGSPLFRSDHEFSPESELEDESQVVPLKRARTARKEGEEVVPTAAADESCQKCGKSDHPEWILLCDKCDKGYHCSCLSPVIFYIPEGDWFCPPCQQEELIAALENHLKEFDDLVQCKKEEEEERLRLEMQERLELEQAAQLKIEKKNKRKQIRNKKGSAGGSGRNRTYRRKMLSDDSADESEENETETDASNSSKSNSSRGRSSRSQSESPTDSDDEPIYKLRKRRQINVSYRLNEYDDMIKSALKEEEDEVAGAGNLGRGKDISTIIEADKEEKLRQQQLRIAEQNGETVDEAEKPAANAAALEDSGSDFEPLKRKPKGGRHLKKKSRKLTTLDISSEGDNDSDEDFKTSSMDDDDEEEDEEEDDVQSSDSSLDAYRRRGRGGKSRKKTRRAARRAARERRKDRKFIVDDSDGSDEEERPRSKKKRKKDSDYTESETNDDDDDELSENIDSEDLCDDSTESEASDDGAWRPSKRKKHRSNTIARKSPKLKQKTAPRPKKTKRVDDNSRSFKPGISKNRAIRDDSDDDDDDADSVDSSRKTRGKRCTYLEDYEDDSSDGGIKPGVKRPDTPPEEREQFIKKQEEIKRMLAEKNAEGAKLAATPRLIPIKAGAQRSPAKLDPLSTVPLSVIRQAKVLDIDYLQRKGESISEGDLEESEFDDDDLPDDFNPEDMDEEAIARMVEEEDFAQQQLKLPPPAEVLRKKSSKELDLVLKPAPSFLASQPQQSTSSSSSGLQEPVRKKLPMPTMHPPLLRHGFGVPSQHMLQQNRSSATPHLPLLQNALSAPPHNPMSRSFPPASQAIPATAAGMGPQPPCGSGSAGGDPNKPRGRRKKITPLRDPLQKQQAAAAASAAAAAASKPRVDNAPSGKVEAKSPTVPASGVVATPGVIKSALSIAQPPQLYKPPPANTQPSVITRMPHVQGRPMIPVNGPSYAEQGSRFYRPQQPQPQQQPPLQQPPLQQGQSPGNALIPGSRPPMRHRGPPMPPLPAHHSLRPSYVGGPPPLRPSSTAPPMSLANDVRDQVSQRQSASYSGSDQQYTPPPARHSAPPHLSPYRPQMFGNPGFPQRGPPTNSSQPSAIRTAGAPPEYASPGSFVGGYSYYPPPLSVPHSAPPPPTASAVPSSVIVSASSLAAASASASSSAAAAAAIPPPPPPTSAAAAPSRPPQPSPSLVEKTCVPAAAPVVPTKPTNPSVIELSRKKLTTLETFNTSKTVTPPPPLTESSESRSSYSSNPPTVSGVDDAPDDGSGSPPPSSQTTSEFSGLVSYFSSQHDDLNT